MTRSSIWSKSFVLAFIINFAFSLGFWSFVHLPGFLSELGGEEAEIGTIVGTLYISAILVRPWLGRMMDERGRKPVLLIGGLVNFMAVGAYLTVDSLGPWLYVIRIVHGLGEAALFSVVFTIAADVVSAERRTEGIAIFGISGLLPLSLGGLLGDWILSAWDYQALFAASTIISGLAFFPCLVIRETGPYTVAEKEKTNVLWKLVRQKQLVPLWILTLAFTFGLTSYFTFLKTYLAETKVATVGLFFLAYSVAAVTLRLFLSWLPDRIGPKKALWPAMISLLLGLVLLAVADRAVLLVLAGVFCGTGHAFVFPIASSLVVSRAEERNRGAAITLFTALFDFGALLGAPILGLLIEKSGYTIMFLSAAGTSLFLTCLFFIADKSDSDGR